MIGAGMWRRRRPFVVTAVVLAVVVASFAVTQAVEAGPPQPAKFHEYLSKYGTGWSDSSQPGRPQRDHLWLTTHRTAAAAAGQRACNWLALRDDAPKPDPSGRSDISTLASTYAQTHHDVPLAWVTRMSVAIAAWNFMCSDVRKAKTAPSSYKDD